MANNAETPADTNAPLLLPPPDASSDAPQLRLGSSEGLRFDELGPMVVNSDGTLSRIANWANLTPAEQERTLRVVGARNRTRIANEEKRLQESTNDNAEKS